MTDRPGVPSRCGGHPVEGPAHRSRISGPAPPALPPAAAAIPGAIPPQPQVRVQPPLSDAPTVSCSSATSSVNGPRRSAPRARPQAVARTVTVGHHVEPRSQRAAPTMGWSRFAITWRSPPAPLGNLVPGPGASAARTDSLPMDLGYRWCAHGASLPCNQVLAASPMPPHPWESRSTRCPAAGHQAG